MTDAGTFVHDMKNLLGVILGYGALLADDMAGEDPRRADLEEITRAAGEAVRLLDRWESSSRGEGA
jgi:hypothetical protein